MKKNYVLLVVVFAMSSFIYGQSKGDIAFVAFNADDDDDFAIVALNDIPISTTIYFTDKSPNLNGTGVELGTSEGLISWNSGVNIITAGTVIIFTDTKQVGNPNFGVSVGLLTYQDAGLDLAASGDTLYATIGDPRTEMVTWLAAIRNNNVADTNVAATGLTKGSTLVELKDTASGVDGGQYKGARSGEINFSGYLSLIGNLANWETFDGSGDNFTSTTFDPFNSTSFSITTASLSDNNIKGFAMYPNPVTNGEVRLTSNSNVEKQVEIYSMLGKQVYNKTVKPNETINVSNLNTGMYMMRVVENGKLATRKLVIK